MSLFIKYYDLINQLSFQEPIDWKYYPNLVIYGNNYHGKRYYLKKVLEYFYGEISLKSNEYEIYGYGNSKKTVMLKQSKYHLEFEPNSNGFDKYVLQKILDEFATTPLVSAVCDKKSLRTIVINTIDNLSYYAQASLRRSMEKYVKTCRFILISDNLAKISETIRSRCTLIRIGNNDIETNKKIIKKICDLEKIKVDLKKINYHQNIEEILMELECKNLKIPLQIKLSDYISDLIEEIEKVKIKIDYKNLEKIRGKIHKLYISNYDVIKILEELMKQFLDRDISIENKYNITKTCTEYNNRLNNGKRSVIHLESVIFQLINFI